jgi:hypothetical protein
MKLRIELIHATIRSSEPLALAVQMLARSRQHAQRANCSPWHFAIDLDDFYRVGVFKFDLRWLLMSDLVEHATEVLDFNHPDRKFQQLPKHIVPADARFILSDVGVAKLSRLTTGTSDITQRANGFSQLENGHQQTPPIETSIARLVPEWDAEDKVLRFNGAVVKQFTFPAPNQEAVLAAFQEEHWPRRIDDPLHPTSEQDARRRLNDTIRYLNQKMVNPFIRFRGDGTGTGVAWILGT